MLAFQNFDLGIHRGFAVVYFRDEESVKKVLESPPGSHIIDDAVLRVKRNEK